MNSKRFDSVDEAADRDCDAEEKLNIKREHPSLGSQINTVIPRPGFGPQDCSAYYFVIQSSRSGRQLPGSPHLVIAPIDVIAVARCS
jgi:hypothetical protein